MSREVKRSASELYVEHSISGIIVMFTFFLYICGAEYAVIKAAIYTSTFSIVNLVARIAFRAR